MNANQIVNMIMRTVMRQLINRGVSAGLDRASRGIGGDRGRADTGQGQTRKQVRQARRAARMANRVTRL